MHFQPGEINIICSDVQKSLHFYRDILGLTAETDAEGFYHLRSGGFQYLLLPIAGRSAPDEPYGAGAQISLDFSVDDLHAAYLYFQQHQVTIAQAWHEGAVMFVVRDPDGLHLEILQATPTSDHL
jgi:catechol 2,3-dioxygenase-like lactoylglutathione lyase family enzyme